MAAKSMIKRELATERLLLKTVHPSMIKQVEQYFVRNRPHFEPSMPDLPKSFYSSSYQMEKIWFEFDALANFRSIRYFLFLKDDLECKRIIGDISISEIVRTTAASCVVGYKTDAEHVRHGYMHEALSSVISELFNGLDFHRIVLNILPDNVPSLRLAEKLGFTPEGLSRSLIKISGVWRDHIRLSLINPNH